MNKYEYIFSIGCFDKLHCGHIKLLEDLKSKCNKLILGIHDNNSIQIIKNITNIQELSIRKENLQKYAYDIFEIYDADPTDAIKNYIETHNIQNNYILDSGYINNNQSNITYNNFSFYTLKFNQFYTNKHADSLRNNHFWVYPKNKKLLNCWDTYDVNICKTHEYIKEYSNNIKEYKCNCKNNVIKLQTGTRAKHYHNNDNIEIYNDRTLTGKMIITNNNITDTLLFNINNNNCKFGGTEDYRYIIFNNNFYIICNGMPKDSKHIQMYIYNVNNNILTKLFIKNVNTSNNHQKNWVPYIYNNELYLIFSFIELCVLKVINIDSGECEIVYGNINNFKNNIKDVFGGTNLIEWKDNLLIGFGHSRSPWYSVPIIFDPINYKLTFGNRFIINSPFKLIKPKNIIVQFPYYFNKKNDVYNLSVVFDDIASIYFTYSVTDINILFNSLLKTNICYIRADDNINFPGRHYISSIMPIQYVSYTNNISTTKLRDITTNIGTLNYLLETVSNILKEYNIPFYIDCGTLLGCVRDNCIIEKDTDVDIMCHLSYWNNLCEIDFSKYDLILIRKMNSYLIKPWSNLLSVKTTYNNIYCDIYVNPAFPLLTTKILNGVEYPIPIEPELYLEMLYGNNWSIPSNTHADTKYHRNGGLLNSNYKKNWDSNFEIYETNM